MSDMRAGQAERVAAVALGTNFVLTAGKLIVGVVSGSTAVIADALHSASDIAATSVVFIGLRLASAPPDKDHHYGHAKMESVAAKIVSLILLVTAAGIASSALRALQSGRIEPPSSLAVWGTLAAIAVKEGLFRYVNSAGRRLASTALRAEAWHHRSDAGSSVAVLAGVVGARMGLPAMDALAGIVVAGLIGLMAVRLYIQSVRELIDEAPDSDELAAISLAVTSTEGVHSINEVKARRSGPTILVDVKLCVDPELTVAEGHAIAGRAKQAILQACPDVADVLIHVNPCHAVHGQENDRKQEI